MVIDKKYGMLRKLYRQFAETEFTKELLDELEATGEYNWDIYKKMAKYGITGIKIPKEYGGAGGDYMDYVLMMEEFARVSVVLSIYANTPNSLGSGPLLLGGSKEQKEMYLPPIARGEKIMCFGLTEPGAGSDAGGTTTTAILDGDEYVVNGRKCFITGAPIADWILCFVKTDPSQKGSKGISLMVIDMDLPGVSTGIPEHKMGIVGYPTSDVIFEDVRVPKSCIVGKVDKGFTLAMQTLDAGRLGTAAQCVGIHQACLEEAVKYSKDRKQFGKRIADFQGISFMLAEMGTELEASRSLTYKAAELKIANAPNASKYCSMAKLYASEACNRAAYNALQIHGGYGYIKEYKIERLYRDARVTSIFEGTSQVQKMVIAANLLK